MYNMFSNNSTLVWIVKALNRLLSTESDEADNPEMVAGRLEIRVVSSPLPDKDTGTVNMTSTTEKVARGKTDLEKKEEEIAYADADVDVRIITPSY